jgi:hypothetical protein
MEKITMASRYFAFTSNGCFFQFLNYFFCVLTLFIYSTLCSAEITFKTDPKNTDYAAEHGASRNFEPWREEQAVEEEDRLAKLEEEENNPMKALENRTTDSKREMDILDALQDIRARNARNERVGHSADIIARMADMESEEDREQRMIEEEDEKVVREVFHKSASSATTLSEDATEKPATATGKRKASDVEHPLESSIPENVKVLIASTKEPEQAPKKQKVNVGIKIAKKKGAVKAA